MPDLLVATAPTFRRIDEYASIWAMLPSAFLTQVDLVRRMNWQVHMAAPAPARRVESTFEMVSAKGGRNIALIKASGTLMKQESSLGGTSTVQLRRSVRAAASDPEVSGILIGIDSPGGTVAGTADLAADIRAARRKKPVYAHVEDMAASAAYWLASQADMVFANNATAKVGSIGTFQVVYDLSAAAEKEGVKAFLFTTGPLKGMGIPGTPVTDDQAANMQALVNETQTHFDAGVRAGRGLSVTELAAVRTGALFPATEAIDRKLIDGIRSLDATVEALTAAK